MPNYRDDLFIWFPISFNLGLPAHSLGFLLSVDSVLYIDVV